MKTVRLLFHNFQNKMNVVFGDCWLVFSEVNFLYNSESKGFEYFNPSLWWEEVVWDWDFFLWVFVVVKDSVVEVVEVCVYASLLFSI